MEGEVPPRKFPKLDEELDQVQVDQPRIKNEGRIFTSPITEPVLMPEIWNYLFEYLPRKDLVTILNTCPEWNNLLENKKTTILLPEVVAKCMRGYLSEREFRNCRQLNKEYKSAIDEANPDISQAVREYYQLERVLEENHNPPGQRLRVWVPRFDWFLPLNWMENLE